MEIQLNYTDWKDNVTTKALEHLSHTRDGQYHLIAMDGPVYYTCELDQDDDVDYESNFLPQANHKVGSFYSREPFASKTLKDGKKLYRRKHGIKDTIPANSIKEMIFTVPYAHTKINKLEIIDANPLDRIDLLIKSPIDAPTAAAYGMPANYLLNQFAFDVVVSSLLYSDKSDYDADIYAGFQVVCVYKNDTNADKEVGFNLIYHEVV
jgi:hypothetical protein